MGSSTIRSVDGGRREICLPACLLPDRTLKGLPRTYPAWLTQYQWLSHYLITIITHNNESHLYDVSRLWEVWDSFLNADDDDEDEISAEHSSLQNNKMCTLWTNKPPAYPPACTLCD